MSRFANLAEKAENKPEQAQTISMTNPSHRAKPHRSQSHIRLFLARTINGPPPLRPQT